MRTLTLELTDEQVGILMHAMEELEELSQETVEDGDEMDTISNLVGKVYAAVHEDQS